MKKGWTFLLMIVGLGLVLYLQRGADEKQPANGAAIKPALTVTLVEPEVRELPLTILANGTLAAWQEAVISAELGGVRLVEIQAQVGDRVVKGQRLALYDQERVKADLEQSEAMLAEAEAMLEEARANAGRVRQIIDEGALSALQAGQYLTGEKTSLARSKAARAQLDIQRQRMRHTEVLAIDDGTISARAATLGAVTNEGQELFRLVRKDRLEWQAEVTASELPKIPEGVEVQVEVPDVGSLTGRVRKLGPTLDEQSRYGRVYVELPGAYDHGFKPGMFAHGIFLLGSRPGLTLPRSSIVVRDGYSFAFRVHPAPEGLARVEEVKVSLGQQDNDLMEVLGGIEPGDRLVLNGAAFLGDGDLVRIVP